MSEWKCVNTTPTQKSDNSPHEGFQQPFGYDSDFELKQPPRDLKTNFFMILYDHLKIVFICQHLTLRFPQNLLIKLYLKLSESLASVLQIRLYMLDFFKNTPLESCSRVVPHGTKPMRRYSLAFSDSVRSIISWLLVLMRTQRRLKVR